MKTNYIFYKDHRFLVIDDDARLREQAISVLLDLGFARENIKEAENGKMALELINSGNFDPEFFIIDLVMPVMNGLDFIKELMKIEKFIPVPKLVLSSENDSNIILNAINAGANNYANKPCEKFILAKKLFECVTQK